jgi:hypothetical protein
LVKAWRIGGSTLLEQFRNAGVPIKTFVDPDA